MTAEEIVLTWDHVDSFIRTRLAHLAGSTVYGVPRGGAIVAGLARFHVGLTVTDDPSLADSIVDDLVDSGATRAHFASLYPGKHFMALIDKPAERLTGHWVRFPWEADASKDLQDHVRRIIEAIGDDPTREDLLETPRRVVDSWEELYFGYSHPADEVLKWFTNEYNETVIMRNIGFWSTCEHHMLPFWGNVDLAYIPNGAVIGISKLARLVYHLSRKLQVQERLTMEIGKALEGPKVEGVAVSVRAHHACMIARGVRQEESHLTTNYFQGKFKDDSRVRQEFLQGIKE